MKDTLAYYDDNAAAFVAGTVDVDFCRIQDWFLQYVPMDSAILDFGCGSGRDSKAFLERGYQVHAVDGSRALCSLAEELLGQRVECCTFQDFFSQKAYNGIWCCASLLHLEWDELVAVLRKLAGCLNDDGALYMSFKHGKYQGVRSGRWFTDLDEDGLELLLQQVPELRLVDVMITGDVRAGREQEKWLNVIVRKR